MNQAGKTIFRLRSEIKLMRDNINEALVHLYDPQPAVGHAIQFLKRALGKEGS